MTTNHIQIINLPLYNSTVFQLFYVTESPTPHVLGTSMSHHAFGKGKIESTNLIFLNTHVSARMRARAHLYTQTYIHSILHETKPGKAHFNPEIILFCCCFVLFLFICFEVVPFNPLCPRPKKTLCYKE